MTFRITILCENTVGPVLSTLGEHGFAALVEWQGGSLLFDTGQGRTLLHNARCINRDLSRLDGVALSHGHYDHAGGLLPLLREHGPRQVFAHPGVFTPRYRLRDTGEPVAIGLPASEEELRGAGATFSLAKGYREILPGIFLTGEVPRRTEFEKGDTGLYTDPEGRLPDIFPDDQSLVIPTERGLVLLLGCCHAGLVNTLEHAREQSGDERVYCVMGGTHLGFSSPEQLEETVKGLRRFRVDKLCPSHCTGFAGTVRLMREFPGGFHPAAVGYSLEV
jgi:7,8-dihydropterin-6-yl-methyl-4-(beta-D-ribofuranosyl)aminobenzene 5'-phosphate synthase